MELTTVLLEILHWIAVKIHQEIATLRIVILNVAQAKINATLEKVIVTMIVTVLEVWSVDTTIVLLGILQWIAVSEIVIQLIVILNAAQILINVVLVKVIVTMIMHIIIMLLRGEFQPKVTRSGPGLCEEHLSK